MPSITTVSQPIKEMAFFAAEILIQHISKKLENKSSNKIFDSELIFRESVKRI